MRVTKHVWLALTAVALAATIPGCVVIGAGWMRGVEENEVIEPEHWYTASKVLILDVEGIIDNINDEGFFGLHESTVFRVKEELERAKKDDAIEAVVLRINSPGGTVTASDILYREIKRFKEDTDKVVVAALMDTATSGAYYTAMAADQIVAHPTTITGSVGVVLCLINIEGLFKKIGVRADTIKSGGMKDMGSPFKPLSPQEAKVFEDTIAKLQARFVSVVKEGRPDLEDANVEKIGTGRIFVAEEALELGMIDKIGDLSDAIELAKQLADIEDASVIVYRKASGHRANIYSRSAARRARAQGNVNLINIDCGSLLRHAGPTFMYLWTPSVP